MHSVAAPRSSHALSRGRAAVDPALLSAEAAGGSCDAAMPAAVAVELVHNFSLLHDDVMDGDLLRRHRPTAWAAFGPGPAILAGDALLALAFDTLAAVGGDRGAEAVRILSAAVQGLVDDILGIWGDPARTGKAIHSDLSTRKKSLPVVAALTSDTPAGRELAVLYAGSRPLSAADVAAAAALVTASGGRAWTEAETAAQLSAALADLHAAHGPGDEAADLESLAVLVTTRDR